MGGGLGVTYAIHLWLVGKLVGPIGYNCPFSLTLTAEALMRRNRPYHEGVCQCGAKYYVEGLRLPPISKHC